MKRRRYDKETKYVLTGGLLLAIYALLVVNPGLVGMDAASAETMYTLFPSLYAILVCIYAYFDTSRLGRFACMVGLGFSFCLFLNTANGEGLITAELLSGLTVGQLQIWTVVVSTVVGGIGYQTGH